MTERRKLFSLIFIAFLVLVLPIALLLSRQRQEIRKKAYDVAGVQQHNLRVNKQTLPQGQTVDVYVEGDGQSYGYILGTLVYDTAYFEPVGVFSPVSSAHSFGAATSSIFRFGANNKTALLSGQMLKLTLRAKQTGITNISLGQSVGVKLDGTSQNFTSTLAAATGISVSITASATSTPTPTPTATLSPLNTTIYPSFTRTSQNSFTYNIDTSFGQLPVSSFVKVFFDSSQVNYVNNTLTNGNAFTNVVQRDLINCRGNNCWIDIDGTSRTAAVTTGGRFVFARIPFTFKTSTIQTATISLGTESYITKQVGGNFTLAYIPNASITYNRNATPTPTAMPTNTPTPTPTATPGTPAPLAITGLASGLNQSTAIPTPNVRISFDTNVTSVATLVLKLPNGDILGPSISTGNPDPGSFGFPAPNTRYIAPDDSIFKHTASATHHEFNVGSLVNGTYYYKVYAASGTQQVSNPGVQYNSFTVNNTSTPTPTPAALTVTGSHSIDPTGTDASLCTGKPAHCVVFTVNTASVMSYASIVIRLPNNAAVMCPTDLSASTYTALGCTFTNADLKRNTSATTHKLVVGSITTSGNYSYTVYASDPTGANSGNSAGPYTFAITQPNASLKLSPSTGNHNVNELFNVGVNLDTGGVRTSGADFILSWSPASALEIQSANDISYNSSPLFVSNTPSRDNVNGRVVSISTMANDSLSFTGIGSLVNIKFKALSAGPVTLRFTCTSGLRSDSNIWSQQQDIINCDQTTGATFNINTSTGVAGDTNGNGCVGTADLGQVALYFRGPQSCTPNEATRIDPPTSDPNGDFNKDGCVNYMDFAVVTSNRFSYSCNE